MWRRIAITVGVIAAAVGAWVVVGPTQLGGPVTYVIASGDSMEPGIRSGDLMLVREADGYEVGDVVAYRHRQLRRVVVHRVVEVEGDRYVLKGDNNDWLDSYSPTDADVVGTPWVRVPGIGRILSGMAEPRNAGLLAGLLTLLSIGGTGVRRHRRRRSMRAADPRPPERAPVAGPQRPRGAWALPLGAGLLATAVGSGALFVWAGGQPARRAATTTIDYSHRGTFSYDAAATRGEAYPDGTATTGDPLFLELVPEATVRFAYELETPADAEVRGTTALTAVLSDESGWSREFRLQPTTPFRGNAATVEGRLDLAALRAMVQSVQDTTGVPRPQYKLVVTPEVTVTGAVAGAPLEDAFSPELAFMFEPMVVRVNVPTVDGEPTADPMSAAESGSVAVGGIETNRLGIGGFGVAPSDLRTPAGLAAAVFGLVGILLLARSRRRGEGDEADAIRVRYGKWIVPVRQLPEAGTIVDVAAFDGLVRLAEQYEALVLHAKRYGGHVFAVHANGVTYRYEVETTRVDLRHAMGAPAPAPVPVAPDERDEVPSAPPALPVPLFRPVPGAEG
ncbi:MAG TPA: signal peptidase I [Acidimicrobiia bacterium]|nr:signal peptidase I [Acidimicrobiia bacterium]